MKTEIFKYGFHFVSILMSCMNDGLLGNLYSFFSSKYQVDALISWFILGVFFTKTHVNNF